MTKQLLKGGRKHKNGKRASSKGSTRRKKRSYGNISLTHNNTLRLLTKQRGGWLLARPILGFAKYLARVNAKK